MRTTLLRRKQRDFPDRALSSATGQRPANKAACILELGGGGRHGNLDLMML